VLTYRCGLTSRQKCYAERCRKETKIQEFMYKDTTKEKNEMRHHTGINWDQCNSNTKFTENLENIPEKRSTDLQQKTAIIGTSHIIRKVPQSET